MKLSSSPKIYQSHKCDYPKNTIKQVEKGFKEIDLKIIYKDKNIGFSDFSIYIGSSLIDILSWSQHGKGISRSLAKASAYAELAERFSTGFIEIKIPLPKNTEKYKNILNNVNSRIFLRGFTKNLDSNSTDFKNINQYFYDDLSRKNYNFFQNEGLLDYLVDAYSLIEEKYTKIPIHLLEVISLSNGIASGNTYEEAISQASFEIFERYAASKIVSEKIKCPTIDINTIKNDKIQNCIKLFKSLNIDVIVKDFSMGFELPVIGVVFINNNIKKEFSKLTKDRNYKRLNAGSHLDLREAIIRCFIEYLQTLYWDRNEIIKQNESEKLYTIWVKQLKKKYIGVDQAFKYFSRYYDYYGNISFLEKGKIISFDKLNNIKNNDSLDDVKKIIEICKNNQRDIKVIDYTHKILKFPTVRIVIPSFSTDFDVFLRKIIKIENFEERLNKLYGIKNFYNYINDDEWIKNNQIDSLIRDIENYLSKELYYYHFYINRENNFGQIINLFHILPFLYMANDKLKNAKKYFKALIKLDYQFPVESSFFKSLKKKKNNLEIYKKHINEIDYSLKNNLKTKYNLKENPFNPEYSNATEEKKYKIILEKIDRSFT